MYYYVHKNIGRELITSKYFILQQLYLWTLKLYKLNENRSLNQYYIDNVNRIINMSNNLLK